MVVQLGVWRPDDPISNPPEAQAEVDIVKRNAEVAFVKPINFVIYLAPHGETGCRHGRYVVGER